MLNLSIEFLAGRYHATSWDHHVNEGLVEWPPSPWRLLRALVAASYKLIPEVASTDVRRVLEPLLLREPCYAVPAATMAHTRHYMPTDDKPTKVFDAFVVPAGTLEIQWPDVELDDAATGLLDRLLAALTYLGRSESWIEAHRIPTARTANCVPASAGNLELWAAEPPSDYASFKARWDEEQLHVQRKQRRSAPADWWEVLHLSTSQLFRDGWSRPPGTRRVRYRFEPAEVPRRKHARPVSVPTAARFELASNVLPRLPAALSVGERVRMALLARSDGHSVFVGRDASGQIVKGHMHAWFLPADDDADGVLDHVLVYARAGFDASARRALEQLRRVWGHGGHDLELTLVALGHPEELGCLRRDASVRALAPQLGMARTWESHTPFVPPRHAKVRGGHVRETPAQQVLHLLRCDDRPRALVEQLDPRDLSPPCPPNPIDWYRFRRVRSSGGGRRGTAAGFGFRIRFEEPVRGPVALGYGAHQGLGQFVAIE